MNQTYFTPVIIVKLTLCSVGGVDYEVLIDATTERIFWKSWNFLGMHYDIQWVCYTEATNIDTLRLPYFDCNISMLLFHFIRINRQRSGNKQSQVAAVSQVDERNRITSYLYIYTAWKLKLSERIFAEINCDVRCGRISSRITHKSRKTGWDPYGC